MITLMCSWNFILINAKPDMVNNCWKLTFLWYVYLFMKFDIPQSIYKREFEVSPLPLLCLLSCFSSPLMNLYMFNGQKASFITKLHPNALVQQWRKHFWNLCNNQPLCFSNLAPYSYCVFSMHCQFCLHLANDNSKQWPIRTETTTLPILTSAV